MSDKKNSKRKEVMALDSDRALPGEYDEPKWAPWDTVGVFHDSRLDIEFEVLKLQNGHFETAADGKVRGEPFEVTIDWGEFREVDWGTEVESAYLLHEMATSLMDVEGFVPAIDLSNREGLFHAFMDLRADLLDGEAQKHDDSETQEVKVEMGDEGEACISVAYREGRSQLGPIVTDYPEYMKPKRAFQLWKWVQRTVVDEMEWHDFKFAFREAERRESFSRAREFVERHRDAFKGLADD